MPDRRLIIGLLTPVIIAAFWLLTASWVWSLGVQRPFTPLAWWDATGWWKANWWVNLWLVLSAAAPSLVLFLLLIGAVQWWRLRGNVVRQLNVARRRQSMPRRSRGAPLPVRRGPTDNHGHSDWRSLEDTKKRFPGTHPLWGGIAVGEAYRVDHDRVADVEFDPRDKTTWGIGGTAPLLIDPCTTGARAFHSAIFAPTGSGKSSELATKALTWTGSSVVFDPTIELGPLLDRALRKQRKRVVHIGLPDPTKPIKMTSFNILAWIDVTHPEAELHLRSVVSWIYDEHAASASANQPKETDRFFGPMGRALVTCLLAHLVWSDPDQIEISLATFAIGMSIPEEDMLSLLTKINANSPSPMARRLAGTFMQAKAAETFSGIYLNAVKGVEWLFSTAYADLLSIGDFDPRTLLLGNCTVFLNISLRTIEVAPAIPRVLIGAILNALYMADGHTHGLIAFFIDEADRVGRLAALKTVRDQGRHFKIVLHMLWQSLAQMQETWGREGTRAWMDSFSWVGYAGIKAASAGKDLSSELGGHGALAFSEGNNQGQQQPFGLTLGTFSRGQNVNVHEISHQLITAPQLQQDMRSDELIIVPDTGMPIRCGRCFWFRRPELVKLLSQ